MVGIDYKTPETKAAPHFGEGAATQPTTQPSDEKIDITHWWKTFNDAELDSLIQRAVVNNNTFLQAEVRVRQARAQLGVEWGTEFPTLSVNGGVSRQQTSRTLSSSVGGLGSTGGTAGTTGTGTNGTSSTLLSSASRRTNLFQGTFNSSWEIDVFGGNRRAIESAGYDLEAQIDARRFALVTLTADVAQDYTLLRGYQAQLKLTKDNVKSEQDTLELTKSRFNAGLVSDLDVAQAQASVATTVAEETNAGD